jgi:phenylalanyl-tRNA synthetase beta chain
MMRPSLVPGMLTMIAGNLHRDVSDVRLFEVGTVFSAASANANVEKVEERPSLALGAVGSVAESGALHPSRAVDFYDMKGVVEQVLGRFASEGVYFDRFPAETGLTPKWLHPYRAARVAMDGMTVGWFGELHPAEAAARKIRDTVLVGEIYLDRLYRVALRKPAARDISRFQTVRRDFSLVLDESIAWEKIDAAVAGLGIPELVDWRAREVFRDAKRGGKDYSLLLGVTFQAQARTLREEELQSFQARVVEAVGKAGARLRA